MCLVTIGHFITVKISPGGQPERGGGKGKGTYCIALWQVATAVTELSK